MTWRKLPTVDECEARLQMLFPRAAFDTVMSNPLAAWSVAALLYVDAIVPQAPAPLPENVIWARPMTVLWLSNAAYDRGTATSRAEGRLRSPGEPGSASLRRCPCCGCGRCTASRSSPACSRRPLTRQ